jgi:murein DD-endopeptidase MepM/ murein hydrolase activator NlpD
VLEKLAARTAPKFLWTGRLERWPRAATQSEFADIRSYVYRGRQIDEQVHLGVDLASTKQAAVTAAGAGVVIFAEKLGIYGNCVVIDHGASLQSIYAHLSRISVQPGEAVRAGREIGRSGNSGLAGGDHLHFAVQVGGVPVTPFEWWNATWANKTVFARLGLGN